MDMFVTLKKIKVKKETQMIRLKVCKECNYILNEKRCKLCGCYLKPKAALLTEKCPDARW